MTSLGTRVVDERLEAMVRAIAEGVGPTRVILFGSRARGDARPDSDYDLVVELEFEDSNYYPTLSRVNGALKSTTKDVSVDVLIRRPGQIEVRRDDPGYMDWDIARHGIVLYPAGASSEALRPPKQVRERRPYESIGAWLRRIEEDLWVVDQALKSGESDAWGAAGFHAQQVAEKYLKILFVQRGLHPPKIHDLARLIGELRAVGYDIPAFDAECKLLNPHGARVRYPEQAPVPNETEGRTVIAAARRIVDAAKALLVR